MKIEDVEKIFVDLIYQSKETQDFVGGCLEDMRARFCSVCGEEVLNSPVRRGKRIYHDKCSILSPKQLKPKTRRRR